MYQSGGAMGFRDQLQDSMALIQSRPEKTAEQKRRKTAYRYANIDIVLSIMIGGAVQEFRVPACGAPFDSEKRNCYLLTRNFRRNG